MKLADRISNIYSLGFVHDAAFVERYLQETKDFILPHAEAVNADMFLELSDLVKNRGQMLQLIKKTGLFFKTRQFFRQR